jgi:hypothetical protein
MVDWSGIRPLFKLSKAPFAKVELMAAFGEVWCPHYTLSAKDNHRIRWTYQLPKLINLID